MLETAWETAAIAHDFNSYNDLLEQILGFNTVFNCLNLTCHDKKNILDYGCGPGKVAHLLATRFPSINITAVDQSAHMLKIAKSQRSAINIDYHLVKENQLDFLAENMMDAAIICFVFINIGNEAIIQLILQQIHKILKPGAPLVILDTDPNSVGIQFSTFINGEPGRTYAYGESRKVVLKRPNQENLNLYDYHWPISMYENNLHRAKFIDIKCLQPTLNDIHFNELKHFENKNQFTFSQAEYENPPFILFQAYKK